jgi:hypothetical protein
LLCALEEITEPENQDKQTLVKPEIVAVKLASASGFFAAVYPRF